jgi:hypothetical protein
VIRIAIAAEAFDAIATTLRLGSVMYEPQITATRGRWVWLDRRAMDRLTAERRRGEDLSDNILRLARAEG